MTEVPRIEPSEVQKKQNSGQKLWFVCGYDDDDRCAQIKIDNGISLSDFTSRVPSLSRDEEIVFYCA
jgi:hypothetical protein